MVTAMTLSPLALHQSEAFLEQIKAMRTSLPVADEFFRQFLEFCTDYEMAVREEMTDQQQYWLFRLGRMLALLGHDPFPNLTFTHPEEPQIGHGYTI